MIKFILFLVFVVLVGNVSSYNILLVFPHPGRSHALLGEAYAHHLLAAGHKITYITPMPMESHPWLKQVDVSSHFAAFDKELKLTDFKSLLSHGDVGKYSAYLYELLLNHQNKTVHDDHVQKCFTESNEKFDLAIIQWLYSEFYCG